MSSSWCHTQIKLVKFSYTWTITNFSFCSENVPILSSIFSTDANGVCCNWRLRVEPKSLDQNSEDFLSLYLILVSCNLPRVQARFKFAILNDIKAELHMIETKIARCFEKATGLGFKRVIWREFLLNQANGFMPDDKLILLCEVTMVSEYAKCSGQETIPFKTSQCGLEEDFAHLLNNPTYADLSLCVSGKVFQLHKAVLAARSPVFAAMFKHEMLEQKQNRIEITDMDQAVLKEMLSFMYSGKTPNLEMMAEDLLAAADKYALILLKVKCEEALCAKVSVESAATNMILADMYSADQLKKQTIDFINNGNAMNIMNTSGWRNMMTTHPHLVAEVFRALVEQKIPPKNTLNRIEYFSPIKLA